MLFHWKNNQKVNECYSQFQKPLNWVCHCHSPTPNSFIKNWIGCLFCDSLQLHSWRLISLSKDNYYFHAFRRLSWCENCRKKIQNNNSSKSLSLSLHLSISLHLFQLSLTYHNDQSSQEWMDFPFVFDQKHFITTSSTLFGMFDVQAEFLLLLS